MICKRNRYLSMLLAATAITALAEDAVAKSAESSKVELSSCPGASGAFSSAEQSYQNPAVVSLNAEPPHAHMRPASTLPEALELGSLTTRMQPLNGEWQFSLVEGERQIPPCFFVREFDTRDWGRLPVPSNWQRHGWGLPVYSNSTLDVEPDEVGLYRHVFALRDDWQVNNQESRIILHLAGVKTAFHVYLNGREVGYNEGAYLPTEFDITDFLKPGENLLAMAVYRVADIQKIENFDTWRLSGIFRDVSLIRRPAVYVEDFQIAASTVNDYRDGQWQLSARIRNKSGTAAKGLKLITTLLEWTSHDVLHKEIIDVPDMGADGRAELSAETLIKAIQPWSAETPNLYITTLELVAGDQLQEATATRTGFRTLEITDGQIRLNGRKIYFKGVNRHEWHPDMARAITPEVTRADLQLMKRHNINAIRTSHYPSDSSLYEMADEYGLYIMDEAAMETHWVTHAEREQGWRDAHVSRMQGMVERDKNHPSVVMWSPGNEYFSGPHTDAMRDYATQRDPSRLIYIDAEDESDRPDKERINSLAYSTPLGLSEQSRNDPRPAVMKEYFHAAGNEMGLFKDLWDVIRDPQYSNLHGGFIWDFKDQGWRMSTPTGSYMDWGRDAGLAATGNDGFDGLVDSLLNPNAKITEVAKVYQDIQVEALDAGSGSFVLHNHHSFLPLSAFRSRYRLQVNGADLHPVELTGLSAPAGGMQTIKLDMQELNQYYRSGDDVRLLFEFSRKVAEKGTPQGHIAAWDQFPLQFAERDIDLTVADSVAGIELIEKPGSVVVRTGTTEFALNTALGRLLSWKIKGRELLSHTQGPQLNLWRAPTDADDSTWGGIRAKYLTPWKQLGIDDMTFREGDLEVVQVDRDRAVIDLSGCLATNDNCIAEVAYRYSFLADGRLAVGVHFAPGEAMRALPGLPRLGLTMQLQTRFDQVEWFGRGPHENYRDRAASAKVGHYRSTAEQLYVPYVPVQANGNRSGVHWLELTDMEGTGLRIQRLTQSIKGYASYFPKGTKRGLTELQEFEFTAIPYTEQEQEAADHSKDLPGFGEGLDKVVLSVDSEHAGVASHPRPTRLPEHEVQVEEKGFVFMFSPTF